MGERGKPPTKGGRPEACCARHQIIIYYSTQDLSLERERDLHLPSMYGTSSYVVFKGKTSLKEAASQ